MLEDKNMKSIIIRMGATRNDIEVVESGDVYTIPEKEHDKSVVAKAVSEVAGIVAE